MQLRTTAIKFILILSFLVFFYPHSAIADNVGRDTKATGAVNLMEGEIERLQTELEKQYAELKELREKPAKPEEIEAKENEIRATLEKLLIAKQNVQANQMAAAAASDGGADATGKQASAGGGESSGGEGGSKVPPMMPNSGGKGGGGDGGGDKKSGGNEAPTQKNEPTKAAETPKFDTGNPEIAKLDDSFAQKLGTNQNSGSTTKQGSVASSSGIDLDKLNSDFKANLNKIVENGKAMVAGNGETSVPSKATASETAATTTTAKTTSPTVRMNSGRGIPVSLTSASSTVGRVRRAASASRGVASMWTGKSPTIPLSLTNELRSIQPRVLGSTPRARHIE